MKKHTKKIFLIAAGVVGLVAVTAGATTYIASDSMRSEETGSAEVQVSSSAPAPTQTTANTTTTQAAPACDDDNIVGKVIGGAAGGAAASNIGKGSGKTAATIGGAVGGSLLGEEFLPTKNVTCR